MTPRLLTRYLLRHLFAYLVGAAGILAFVLAMVFFVRLFQFAAEKGIPLTWTLGSFGRLTPYLFSLTVPIAFLVATVLTLAQFAESGEIVALRASGFSPLQILKPFLAVAAVLSAVLLALNHRTSPQGLRAFRDSFREGLREVTRLDLTARSLTEVGPFRFYAEKIDAAGQTFSRALLYRQGASEGIRVEAAEGAWRVLPKRGFELTLENGHLQLPNKDPSRLTLANFGRYTVFVPFVPRGWSRVPTTRELASSELRDRIAAGTTDRLRAEAQAELAARTATALSPLVFLAIAAPLGLRIGKRSRHAAFAWLLGALFAYYGLVAFGLTVGGRHLALAGLAPWLADAAGLALGAALTWRALR